MLAIAQIKVDGTIVKLGGKPCSLSDAQEFVRSGTDRGLIQPVYFNDDEKHTFFVHEEGLLYNLPINEMASVLMGQTIVGDVLVVENEAKDYV